MQPHQQQLPPTSSNFIMDKITLPSRAKWQYGQHKHLPGHSTCHLTWQQIRTCSLCINIHTPSQPQKTEKNGKFLEAYFRT
ncbi:hypothetical protein NC651_027464 [Populus alba x Populus x berolinensis]|nr:hypothetical protein NC651_027464 [Populus alba x Populus x berolinensis]